MADDAATQSPAPAAAEAAGRRIVSTAFVRLGAGEALALTLHDGRTLVLHQPAMRPKAVCGRVDAGGGKAGCARYAEVADARSAGPAAAPMRDVPDARGPAPIR